MEDVIEEPRELGFEFRGTAGEYFGIWIVNLLLSIITLGIYSAWAKVRTNRYFYGNTLVAGSAFDYTADPRKILVGRVIAVSMLIIYQACILFFPGVAAYVFIVFLLLVPLIYMASVAFRMRYSEWRGICFGFDRNVPGAYLLFLPFIVYALLLVFGPYFFGVNPDDLIGSEEMTPEQESAIAAYSVFALMVVLIAFSLFPLWQRFYFQFIGNRIEYGRSGFTIDLPIGAFYKIYLGVIGLFLFGLMLAFILLAAFGGSVLLGADDGQVPEISVWFVLAIYVILLIPYVLVFAYLRTRLTNLLYSSIRLDGIEFESTLKFGRILSLYISNALAIILTLGMAIPWAKIRVARYRAEQMVLRADSLEGFVAKSRREVDASADAMSDIFDFDIGI